MDTFVIDKIDKYIDNSNTITELNKKINKLEHQLLLLQETINKQTEIINFLQREINKINKQ
tara:strand:+ start:519 stop:701 length:183 start_codon:yes stop_codon:yes gene_type:complete